MTLCTFAPLSDPGRGIRTRLSCVYDRSHTHESESLMRYEVFGAQSRGFCTRCLRFTNPVAKTHARLASSGLLRPSGWNARFPVAPIRSFQKVFFPMFLLPRAFVSQREVFFNRRSMYSLSPPGGIRGSCFFPAIQPPQSDPSPSLWGRGKVPPPL